MAAPNHAAAALVRTERGSAPSRMRISRASFARTVSAAMLAIASGLPLLLSASPALAANDKVRITGLTDVAFGSIANLGVDAVRSQSVCVFSSSATNGYNVTATGTGPGGAFELSTGSVALPFEVQWSGSAGQSSGTKLNPNVPLTGQTSTAAQQTCNSGPATSASLIVILRSTALSSATAGAYNGAITLVVGPE